MKVDLSSDDRKEILRVLELEIGEWPSTQLLRMEDEIITIKVFLEIGKDFLTAADRLEASIEFAALGGHISLAKKSCARLSAVEALLKKLWPDIYATFRAEKTHISVYNSAAVAKFLLDDSCGADIDMAFEEERRRCVDCAADAKRIARPSDIIGDGISELQTLLLDAAREARVFNVRKRADICESILKSKKK